MGGGSNSCTDDPFFPTTGMPIPTLQPRELYRRLIPPFQPEKRHLAVQSNGSTVAEGEVLESGSQSGNPTNGK
jgi:hypothetical protein